MKITEFFEQDYIDFSVYDNVRKIASYIDGQKNSTRKVVYTLLETNCDSFTKVSNLGPRVQDFSQYLHGSLEGGICNMTQDYVASGNNVPLLIGDGNFGTRFIPSPAASRYIFAKANPIVKSLFKKEDNVNLINQVFEGDKIEPKFYVPTLPLILTNQQEGMSIGFAQKILPRKIEELKKFVLQKAQGKRVTADLTPYWNGQNFKVEQGETKQQWVITGGFERNSSTKITINSLPIGYNLKGYQNVLDKLVDDKVIRDYDDLSDNDEFCFEVIGPRDLFKKDDQFLLEKFKLIKRVSENFTCVDENNKIVQFESARQVIDAWWVKRVEFNGLRKQHLIDTLTNTIESNNKKMQFIQGVLNDSINLKDKETLIIKAALSNDSNLSEDEAKSFLRLPLRQLSKEEVQKLKKQIALLKTELKATQSKEVEQFSIDDMAEL